MQAGGGILSPARFRVHFQGAFGRLFHWPPHGCSDTRSRPVCAVLIESLPLGWRAARTFQERQNSAFAH